MKFPVLVRVSHYYASMLCCFLFAFYAASGFLATHAAWFIGDASSTWEATVVGLPDACVEDEAAQMQFCTMQLLGAQRVEALENDEFETWLLVQSEDAALWCVVDVDQKQVEIRPLQTIPATSREYQRFAAYVAQQHGGTVKNVEWNETEKRCSLDVESVWFQAEVKMFQDRGLYAIKFRPAHFIRAISDLHRGKHANGFQIFLADLTALTLLFVIVSGAVLGIQMKKRRFWGISGLVFSALLSMLLVLFR